MDYIDKQILGYLMRDGSLGVPDLVDLIFDVSDPYDKHKRSVMLRYRLSNMVGSGEVTFDRKSKTYALATCVICDESTVLLHNAVSDIKIPTGPVILFELPGGDSKIVFLEQP
ncbi:MAG: hypothetical protein WC565_03250 [Parcubacteria group bacterium]|jgi:hypothetical protein